MSEGGPQASGLDRAPVPERWKLAAPTVTAVIATYNRAQDLRVCLRALTEQSRPPDQILVIDDASPEETRSVVTCEFPGVTYVRLPRNQGQSYARNLGLASACTDYVLLLDDDSWFVEPDALERSLDAGACVTGAGAFAFNVVGPSGSPLFEPGSPSREVATFVGCGSLLRRAAVEQVGYFAEDFVGMGEEEDLSLRLLSAGYRIVALPRILVYHAESPANRSWTQIRYRTHRNAVLRELLRCPAPWLPYFTLRTWLSQSRYNLKNGYWSTDRRVLANLPVMLLVMFRSRRPVTKAAYRAWRRLLKAADVSVP